MKPSKLIMLLVASYLLGFLETRWPGRWFGVQLNLLPCLVVYGALQADLLIAILVPLLAGLTHDLLSANPIGLSAVIYLLVSYAVFNQREKLVYADISTQSLLGTAAALVSTLAGLFMLMASGHEPIAGLGFLWVLTVICATSALFMPLFFAGMTQLDQAFSYPEINPGSYRTDREIKRGRN